MMRCFLLCLSAIMLTIMPGLAQAETVAKVKKIKRLGITWTFDRPVAAGKFANGDPWIQGPVTILSVTPRAAAGRNGIMLNPSDQAVQAYDDRFFGFSAEALVSFPLTVRKTASIVKTISVPETKKRCRPCIQKAAVLTVLEEIPASGGKAHFRPPVFGSEKPLIPVSNIDWNKIPSIRLPAGGPSLFETARQYSMIHLDHMSDWMGQFMHPKEAMPDYGAAITTMNATSLISMLGKQKTSSKEKALIRYLNNGIDLVYMMKGGVRWPNNGGHSEGRKLPIAFTAHILGLTDIFDHPAYTAPETFGENSSVRISQDGRTVLYGPKPSSEDKYWRSAILDKGARTIADPYGYIDGGQRPGSSYQYCCQSQPWTATIIAAGLVPGLSDLLDLPDMTSYVRRWDRHGTWTQPDICAPITGICKGGSANGATCTSANAEAVCGEGKKISCNYAARKQADYGVKYGPDGKGSCIRDTDPSDGIGRYPQLHGSATGEGYYGSKWISEIQDQLNSGKLKPGQP